MSRPGGSRSRNLRGGGELEAGGAAGGVACLPDTVGGVVSWLQSAVGREDSQLSSNRLDCCTQAAAAAVAVVLSVCAAGASATGVSCRVRRRNAVGGGGRYSCSLL